MFINPNFDPNHDFDFDFEDRQEKIALFSTYRRHRNEYERRRALDPRDPERLDDEDAPEEPEI